MDFIHSTLRCLDTFFSQKNSLIKKNNKSYNRSRKTVFVGQYKENICLVLHALIPRLNILQGVALLFGVSKMDFR